MNLIPTDDRLGLFLVQLATKTDAKDRIELFQNAVIETGGDFTLPASDGGRCSHLVELSLFGIHDAGGTAAEALSNWTVRATEYMDRKRETGAAERIVLGDLCGIGDETLRAAAERVRLHSQDMAAIDAARRIDAMLAKGCAA